MSQLLRVRIYQWAALPLSIILFIVGKEALLFGLVALLVLLTSLERCARCGGSLLVFGWPKEFGDDGRMICRRCAK